MSEFTLPSNDDQVDHLITKFHAVLPPTLIFRRGRFLLLHLDENKRLRAMILSPQMVTNLQATMAESLCQFAEHKVSQQGDPSQGK